MHKDAKRAASDALTRLERVAFPHEPVAELLAREPGAPRGRAACTVPLRAREDPVGRDRLAVECEADRRDAPARAVELAVAHEHPAAVGRRERRRAVRLPVPEVPGADDRLAGLREKPSRETLRKPDTVCVGVAEGPVSDGCGGSRGWAAERAPAHTDSGRGDRGLLQQFSSSRLQGRPPDHHRGRANLSHAAASKQVSIEATRCFTRERSGTHSSASGFLQNSETDFDLTYRRVT